MIVSIAVNSLNLLKEIVRPQHRPGIGSMLSGGEIQQEDACRRDLADGVGPDRHLGLIAGRSTWGAARYDWDSDTFDNEPVLAHACPGRGPNPATQSGGARSGSWGGTGTEPTRPVSWCTASPTARDDPAGCRRP